ncbi:hypothetical protein CBM2633_P310004 [Cupriavidus taiwanensis]|uniref:Uncharacterized protein n=2 Tax=Cupriavidus TaxID=106589 RepID=A0A375HUL9_9BURK|nr:hypothetical protein CBM2585_P310002 [Cupriavidus taiwanensis]SPD62512.1 protein of unknown function [Cupriavidus neocaledonicus]SOY75873.1 hypothetical protein CBM2592_P340005 [Cupriavidus taiwanensis]SOY75879.1 hypothetical protein CBM2588_P350004 [Cupriavidus taiwanensis]SOY76712.1 hypothetical protein CBM2589_P320005 [Cupriavidus taiwanensis]
MDFYAPLSLSAQTRIEGAWPFNRKLNAPRRQPISPERRFLARAQQHSRAVREASA